MNQLPQLFTHHIADRLGCGIAIILRGTYLQFETAEEWNVVKNLLDTSAKYKSGRVFVFDGIASCIENSIPNGSEFDSSRRKEDTEMSTHCATSFVELLCKFASGAYENDMSLSLPAMFCLEKVYNYLCHGVTRKMNPQEEKKETYSPDHKLWENSLEAYVSVSISTEAHTAKKGVESLQRFLLSTKIESIPGESWLKVLDLLSSQLPPVELVPVRTKYFDLLTRMILIHVPLLCKEKQKQDQLTTIIHRVAASISENLSVGRQGTVSTLFESTVQLVTNLSNVLLLPEFVAEEKFNEWAGNTLFEELEKVGAGGGSARMINATSAHGV